MYEDQYGEFIWGYWGLKGKPQARTRAGSFSQNNRKA